MKVFLFRVRPKWVIRKYGVYYWTTDGKLREIMRLWKYFAVPKSSFLRLFKNLTSYIAEVISSRADLLH